MPPIKDVFELDENLMTDEVRNFIKEAKNCVTLYAKKNHDYGNSFDKGMETIGLAYGIGRIYDKVNRLVTLTKAKQAVTDESIDDTLKDLACYSIMMLAYRTKEINNKQKEINFE